MNARTNVQNVSRAVAIAGPDDEPRRDLTGQQRAFVSAYVEGPTAGNGRKSAIKAGYSEKSADVIACGLLKLQHVASAIDETLRDLISGAMTVEAVALLRRVVKDENAPLKLRADCAARVVEYSGIVDRTRLAKGRATGLDGATGPDGKRLGELTRGELERIVQQGAAILTAAAALPGPVIEGKTKDFVETPAPAKAKGNGFNRLSQPG